MPTPIPDNYDLTTLTIEERPAGSAPSAPSRRPPHWYVLHEDCSRQCLCARRGRGDEKAAQRVREQTRTISDRVIRWILRGLMLAAAFQAARGSIDLSHRGGKDPPATAAAQAARPGPSPKQAPFQVNLNRDTAPGPPRSVGPPATPGKPAQPCSLEADPPPERPAPHRPNLNHCLAKSISDAAWALFLQLLSFKAECAGRTFVAVNPAYTSQDCSACGHRRKTPLKERIFSCPCCLIVLDRDHNAALNILHLGLIARGLQRAGLVLGSPRL